MAHSSFASRESLQRSSQIPHQGRPTNPRRNPLIRRKGIAALSVIGLLILVIGGWLLTHRAQDFNNVGVIRSKVSRHYLLPTDEIPALATVTDSSKVQSSFRGKVNNGDKILIYQTNKKAIVYRPAIDRVVDVEPVSIDTPPSATSSR